MTSVERLREELHAAETALADGRSQLSFAKLSAEKNVSKAHSYERELHLERQHNNALEGDAFCLAEAVTEDLEMSELLCAEAQHSADDAMLIRKQAVAAAKVLAQAHVLLTRGQLEKARAREASAEAFEAYAWKRDALSFEEQRAKQLREVWRNEAEATQAALGEYRTLRMQRDHLHTDMAPDNGDANGSMLLDEAEILQNQLEMALGLDLLRRMRKAEELQDVQAQRSKVSIAAELKPSEGLRSSLSSRTSKSSSLNEKRSGAPSSRKSSCSEVSKKDPRRTPAELRSLEAELHRESMVERTSATLPSEAALTEQSSRSRRSSQRSSISDAVPALDNRNSVEVSGEQVQVGSSSRSSWRVSQSEGHLEDAKVSRVSLAEAPDLEDAADTSPQPSPPLEEVAEVTEAIEVTEVEAITSPASQKSSLSYSSRGIPSASQTRAAERSPRSPSVSPSATSRSPRSSPKKEPFKPSSPSPRLITKHPPASLASRPYGAPWQRSHPDNGLRRLEDARAEERRHSKTSSISPSHRSQASLLH